MRQWGKILGKNLEKNPTTWNTAVKKHNLSPKKNSEKHPPHEGLVRLGIATNAGSVSVYCVHAHRRVHACVLVCISVCVLERVCVHVLKKMLVV